MKHYHITGNCHVDLAWLADAAQYACYQEQFIVLLLDLLEQDPDVTYVLEQAYHFRELKKRRPDLLRRLQKYIAEGRLEVVGGMISTADTNMPCAESLVRNQLLGLRWFSRELHADVQTGWLLDAFGCSAQIPQILAEFGMRDMLATRFGGDKHSDVFIARGLDGTDLLVAGRDCFSPNLPADESTRVFFDFANRVDQVDTLFRKARRSRVEGPVLVDTYIEDESYPTRRMTQQARMLKQEAEAAGDRADFSLPRNFFAELRQFAAELPVESADLNPEFTGTYSQRVEIKLHNRRAERALLEAEQWLALRGQPPLPEDLWWDMGFVHFHDVFTGSHPTCVFEDVLRRLDHVQKTADDALTGLFGEPEGERVCVVNPLPYPRREWVRLADGREFEAEVGPCAGAVYEPKAAGAFSAETTVLENEFLFLAVDSAGVTLRDKRSGRTILEQAADLLVLQSDTGSFQMEQIEGSELHAWARTVSVQRTGMYTVTVCGRFEGQADWKLFFTLYPGEEIIRLNIQVDWKAAGQRLRLKLASTLCNAGDGIYEIPFGVVRRRAYTPAFSRKGEWPAQRFAAVEDAWGGLALLNTGVPGVECLGGTLYTTLLRAPAAEYAGMVPDCSSSQHGTHRFSFALMPYIGAWQQAGVVQAAQRFNHPLRTANAANAFDSRLAVDSKHVVFSVLKQAEESDGLILRLYESAGTEGDCTVTLPGVSQAFASGMTEAPGAELPFENGVLRLHFQPWQIRTVYLKRRNTQ